jgi:hypothetical protein
MSDFRVLDSDGLAPRAGIARVATSDPAQKPLTIEQLVPAMGLVDEILDSAPRASQHSRTP